MHTMSRLAAVIGAVGCFVVHSPDDVVAAAQFPYCAASRGFEQDYMNCSFATFEACLEELKGMRGYCAQNPYYVAVQPPARLIGKPQRPRSRD